MSNLKKVLAIGVALIMAFGLMISASAFTDDAAVKNTDAANMLTELSIISGFPDGSFRPESGVTRAQMAKMIYVAMRGGLDDNGVNFVNSSVPLSDANNHWASGYIKYAYGLGIISGFPDGSFRPDSTVTGYQAAKMLLTALGYDSAAEGYSGTGWDFRVAVDAASAGLLDGLEGIDLSSALTRDQAALMIYNALFADMVKYSDGTLETTGSTFAEAKLKLETVTGVLVATEEAGITAGGASDEDTCIIVNDDGDSVEIPGDADISLLGQDVTAYVKMKADGVTIDKLYGNVTATEGENNVFTSYEGDFAPDDDAFDDFSFDGGTLYSYNYAAAGAKADDPAKGDMTVYIDNDDDMTVDYVVTVAQVYGEAAVKSPSSGSEIKVLGLIGSYTDVDDVKGASGIEDGDKVIGYAIESANAMYAYAVSEAPSFTGTLTGTKSGDKIKVDGTYYEMSEISGVDAGALYDSITASGNFGEMMTFYTDGNYIVDFDTEAESESAYIAIREYSAASGSGAFAEDAKVAVTLADGSETIYTVASIDGKEISDFSGATYAEKLAAFNAALASYDNQVAGFDMSEGEIELGDIIGSASLTSDYSAGFSTLKTSGGTYVVNSDTLVFAYNADDDDFDVYAGRTDIPDMTAIAGIEAVDADASPMVADVVLATAVNAAESDNYAVLIDYEIRYSSADSGYYLNLTYFDGDQITALDAKTGVGLTGKVLSESLEAGDLLDLTLSGGKISDFDIVPAVTDLPADGAADAVYAGYVQAYEEGAYVVLREAGTGSDEVAAEDLMLEIADDCIVVDLGELDGATCDLSGVDPVTSGDDIADADAGSANTIVRLDDDGNVAAIYYFSGTTIG